MAGQGQALEIEQISKPRRSQRAAEASRTLPATGSLPLPPSLRRWGRPRAPRAGAGHGQRCRKSGCGRGGALPGPEVAVRGLPGGRGMAAGDEFGSGASGRLDPGALMEQVKVQIAVANAQELLQRMTDKCFRKCIGKPGSSLDNSEQKCIAMCMDRYMDAWNTVSRAYNSRLQRERANIQRPPSSSQLGFRLLIFWIPGFGEALKKCRLPVCFVGVHGGFRPDALG
ncbi:mitochondrial import inner membrane translocase subunit Tim13 [Crotalus adamanteus]|uniref:Mitochondrial import inner membrane translocase subunit Tim13 n=1 Tax=Crotalus adamanteus TaxID=8729 RepID=A0AAW1C427_CROAD